VLVKQTVLVVDDDPLILRAAATVLDLEEFEVVTSESAEEALERLETSTPDLLVADIMLPGMDGFELCRRVRSEDRLARLPIVVLTARDGGDDRRRGAEVGVDAYMTKPFSPLELIDQIDRLLDERS
jgi:DNA-binding response OmpR family regulator